MKKLMITVPMWAGVVLGAVMFVIALVKPFYWPDALYALEQVALILLLGKVALGELKNG